MVFNYSRERKYIHKATRNTQRNYVPIINPSRLIVASYDRSVKCMAAHIWNEYSSTTRNIKCIEAHTKIKLKTKQPMPEHNGEHSY